MPLEKGEEVKDMEVAIHAYRKGENQRKAA